MSDQPPPWNPPPVAPRTGPVPPGYYAQQPPTSVPDYLVWAVLQTMFCCQPLGIAALVYAARASGKASAGDIAGGLSDAATARKLLLIGLAIGLFVIVGLLTLYAVLIALGIWGASVSGDLQSFDGRPQP